MTQTNYLYDNCLIRICLILLLITYHAFCPFSSAAWTAPAGANPESYKWIAWIAYSCMLESFVFISGQILGFQVLRKGSEILNPRNLLVKKFNRLIIPSILFSLLYYLLFEDLSGFGVKSIVSIFGGTGHLWFLPMLFWCFCGVLILSRLRLKNGIIIPILILCSVLSVIKLPFQLSLTGYYFLFFFTGYLVGTKQWNVEKYINLKTITLLSLLFICVFPIASIIKHSDNYLFINNIIGGVN